MFPRATRPFIAAIVVALAISLLSGLAGPPVVVAKNPIGLPAYRELIQNAARQSWLGQSAQTAGGSVAALVQLDMLPLALTGMEWDHARRRSYSADIRAAQDGLAAEVAAMGGQVLARFSHLSTGMVVQVNSAQTEQLRALPRVAAVMYVGDYAIDSTLSAAPLSLQQLGELVGSTDVHLRGNDGSGIDIALIDTGVDYTHRKLAGSGSIDDYRRAACGDAALQPGQAGCNPQLAPPADLFPTTKVRGGYDYVGDIWPNPDPRCGAVGSCSYSDPNPIDTVGHGTHVADIAAGLPLAADGSDAGIAPGANIWAFKACNGEANLCEGVALLRAIDAALDLDGSDQRDCNPLTDANCLAYDPADVINLSLSFGYGQPEDALTLFADIAGYYGSLVVAAAGNDGDKPYIVGSPATAAAALAVAESALPGSANYVVVAGGRTLDAQYQSWSNPIRAATSLTLHYGDGSGANSTGCTTLASWAGALMLDRDGCTVAVKVANAMAAGASLLLVADNARADTPPTLAGESSSLPVYSITRADSDRLRATLAAGPFSLNLAPATNAPTGEIIADSSSRGPRIADGRIKPDMAAPGGIVSAQAGSGVGLAPFGGTSGSAPVVAGAAALIIQELEQLGVLNPDPGLGDGDGPNFSLAPLVKAVLMNGAFGELQTSAGIAAPITLQGAGRLDALRSFRARTLVMDATEMIALLESDPALRGCSVQPYADLFNYLVFNLPLPCAMDYPFGNALLRAWNGQVGSISFGYRPAVGYQEIQREVVVYNYSRSSRDYELSTSLRYNDDFMRGVELTVSPKQFTLDGGGTQIVTVTAKLSPRNLRDWTLNGGALGNRGTAICDSPDPVTDCPSLTLFEIDGMLRIDGGERNRVQVPWQILPRKAADVGLTAINPDRLTLRNPAPFKDGTVEAFALVEVSPNKCDKRSGMCADDDYTPGALPGSSYSPVDLHYVGMRGYSVPGLNAEFGLPPAPAGALADELIEFAATVYDKPYRASPNFPVQFEVHIDSNRDGVTDYVAFSDDFGGGRDGRSAVFVRDTYPADGTVPTQPYLFTVADFNSQTWVLPVPASAVGLRSDQPFSFVLRAYDAYFRGGTNDGLWDCSPGPLEGCGATAHTMQSGLLRYTPVEQTVSVPSGGTRELLFSANPDGDAASPAQIGLLLLYRDATPGQEAAGVLLP